MVSAVLARLAKAARAISAAQQATCRERVKELWNPRIDSLSPLWYMQLFIWQLREHLNTKNLWEKEVQCGFGAKHYCVGSKDFLLPSSARSDANWYFADRDCAVPLTSCLWNLGSDSQIRGEEDSGGRWARSQTSEQGCAEMTHVGALSLTFTPGAKGVEWGWGHSQGTSQARAGPLPFVTEHKHQENTAGSHTGILSKEPGVSNPEWKQDWLSVLRDGLKLHFTKLLYQPRLLFLSATAGSSRKQKAGSWAHWRQSLCHQKENKQAGLCK